MNRLLVLVFGLAVFSLPAQRIKPYYGPFPEPVPGKHMLFYLQRTIDRNTVIYELNYEVDGRPNEKKPVKVYWIDFEDGAKISTLTFAQNKFAYGIESELVDRTKGVHRINLVSYKKIKIFLIPSAKDKSYRAHVTISGRPAVLISIMVHITGGTYLKPTVSYVELIGQDLETAARLRERFKPDTD